MPKAQKAPNVLWPVRGHPLPMNCVKLVGHGQARGALQPGRGDFGGGHVHPVCRAGGLACPSGKDQRALT